MPPPVPGWAIEPSAGGAWRLANAFDIADRRAPAFRSRLELSGPVILTRTETVPPDKHECVLWLARPLHAVGQPTVEISLDGRRGRPVAVPEMGDQGEIRPIAMPWSDAGPDRDVEIRIRIDPASGPGSSTFAA